MDIFRKHIIQWLAGSVLLVGMSVHLILPYSNTAKKASFAYWLNGNMVADGAENETVLRNHIKNLPHQSESFEHFLKKVSSLVAENQNDFRFPSNSEKSESDNLSQWLFKQWTVHVDIHANQNSILPDHPLPLLTWLVQNPRILSGFVHDTGFVSQIHELLPVDMRITLRYVPIPFLSGISINAP